MSSIISFLLPGGSGSGGVGVWGGGGSGSRGVWVWGGAGSGGVWRGVRVLGGGGPVVVVVAESK